MMNYFTLNNGITMPVIGMGTWPLNGLKFALLVRKAIKFGYCSFDLASAYGNEKWFGRGLKICSKHRKECFITSKLSNTEQRAGNIRAALQSSLTRLGIDYLDLYLIHWPVPKLYLDTWKQLEVLYKEGFVRAIGVCNCHIHHLIKIIEIADVIPAVNQIEHHPLLSQPDLVKFCKDFGIQVEAYSPFARMHDRLIKNETLKSIAEKHNKTIPQIILRWDLQQGIVSVPKASKTNKYKENIDIFSFSLSDEEMKLIDLLNINFRVRYDPDNCDYSKL